MFPEAWNYKNKRAVMALYRSPGQLEPPRGHVIASLVDVYFKRGAQNARKWYEVPEAPVISDIPDLDTLLNSDGKNTLLDLQPSQWMPPTQASQRLPCGRNESAIDGLPVYNETVSKRGDCDDIYLGSQFPLVHKIGPSQVPVNNARQVWNVHSVEPSQKSFNQSQFKSNVKIPQNKTRVYVAPRTVEEATDIPQLLDNRSDSHLQQVPRAYSGKRTLSTPVAEVENDSQEDLFEDSMFHSPKHHTNVTDDQLDRGRKQWKQSLTPAGRAHKDQLYTPDLVAVPLEQYSMGVKLRPVTQIPENFRRIFNFAHFNIVQSKVFDDVMYTDKCLVLCSPTGSGKTAVFEMAIVRLLVRSDTNFDRNFKIVYMAPIKALCSEKFNDWKTKFEPYGLKIMELTGDTDTDDFYELQSVNIILTTPEKWDSMTRKWRDNKTVMNAICLFLIDEIHILNDPTRGSVVEAVASRMKTIQAAKQRSRGTADLPALRFLAISATITNIEDLAEWLGHGKIPAVHYRMDDSVRPVRLRKVVLGYHFVENKQSEFQFDISLSYKLAGVINTYSDNKPVLIFCATRKSSMQGAEILSKDVKSFYVRNSEHRLALQNMSFHLKDSKLRDLVVKGIGYHHAGMDVQDRKIIEETFAKGELPILVATSTLAMGVNLPAHLVIIKSTMYYNMGSHQEYPDTQVLQMIGRAGRPQFDTSATAVIMTKNQTKMKYENLLNGTQLIESSLHKNLVEHLNAEIVLNTITDISVAVEWLKYTFLYIRVMKNPTYYGMPSGLSRQSIEKRLQDLCMKSLNQLNRLDLIQMNEENMDVRPTESGRLMARYCISYKTAELFLAFKGDESLQDMLNIISKCQEFDDIKLRNNEKKTLNTLNKDKNRITIRYPMAGKIKTTDMKVNCLIQATFGSLLIQDFALQQDTNRIFRAGIRVTRCLVEFLSQKSQFKCLLSALLLCKSFKARLWEDSKFVSKQLDGIGPTLSTALVNAGLTSFEKLEEKDPREIELIVNRHPPFGNQVKDNIAKLPKYELVIEQVMKYSVNTADIVITLQITNRETLTNNTGHTCTLIIGDADNKVVYKQRIMDALLLKETSWSKKLEVNRAGRGPELSVHYISQDWVGLDVECTYSPNYLGGNRMTTSNLGNPQIKGEVNPGNMTSSNNQPCLHTCHNKLMCAHECCKNGVSTKRRNPTNQQTPKQASTKQVASHLQELKNRAATLPPTPSLNKKQKLQDRGSATGLDFSRFAYTPYKFSGSGDNKGVPTSNGRTGVYGGHALNHDISHRPDLQPVQERQGSNFSDIRQRNDWQELDMYAKHRQTLNPDDDILHDEASLPDIEASHEEFADGNMDVDTAYHWETTGELNDGFGHETDYGYTYVTNGDRPDLPLEWDDRMNEEWQEQNRSVKDNNINYSHRFGRQVNACSGQPLIQGSKEIIPLNHRLSNCALMNKGAYNVSPADKWKKRTPTRKFTLGKETRGKEFKNDSLCNVDRSKPLDVDQFYTCKNEKRRTISGRQVFDRDNFPQYNASGLPNVQNDYRVIPLENKENIEPDEYNEFCDEETDRQPSRWTDYFSSQSSSASDNVNWKYPARNGDNKVFMETCNVSNTKNIQKVASRRKIDARNIGVKQNTNTGISDNPFDDNKDCKYGEVLAWVSNSKNNQLDAQNNKPESNCSFSGLKTSTSKPEQDSFIGIFDGIL